MNELVEIPYVDGIYDILITEPAPGPGDIIGWITIIIFLLSPIFLILYKRYYSRKSRCIRSIRKDYLQFTQSKLSTREFVYRLSAHIQSCFNLQQLNADTLLPVKLSQDKQQWDTFCQSLYSFKYSQENKDKDIEQVFNNGINWVKKWK